MVVDATFREAMSWLHTWAGVVLGGLLFAIFWMGTLSVFDREIDRWMMPDTRFTVPAEAVGIDALVDRIKSAAPDDTNRWDIRLPTNRQPVVWLRYRAADGGRAIHHFNPTTGAPIPDQGTLAGTRFLYPFHVNLHLHWNSIGIWFVGLAGMAMLTLLVSGVIIHRKILAEFFVFRAKKNLPRSTLDLHNLTSILALPFHFVITLSGLIIFSTTYFPAIKSTVYNNDNSAFGREAFGSFDRRAVGVSGALASLDAMVAEATYLWGGEPPGLISVYHPGDANAFVKMYRNRRSAIELNIDTIHFDATNGEILHEHSAEPILHIQRFIGGLHSIVFERSPMRWVYFLLGLSGCVMIGSGFVFWIESRRKRHEKLKLPGVRIVEGLAVSTVTGILIATLAFFVSNRLLPLGVTFAGYERAALEVWSFYLIWLAALAHAWLRPSRAWREQCWAIMVLAGLSVALNSVTTGDHLLKTIVDGYWPVAGMDLLLIFGAAVAAMTALRLSQNDTQRQKDNAL